jgi:hypothetical protein
MSQHAISAHSTAGTWLSAALLVLSFTRASSCLATEPWLDLIRLPARCLHSWHKAAPVGLLWPCTQLTYCSWPGPSVGLLPPTPPPPPPSHQSYWCLVGSWGLGSSSRVPLNPIFFL